MAIRWPARRGEISAGGASSLSGLSDVTSAAVTDKFALMANGSAYVGRALVEADISDLGSYGVGDVTLSGAQTFTGTKTFGADQVLEDTFVLSLKDSASTLTDGVSLTYTGADSDFASVVLLVNFDGADEATAATDASDSAHSLTFNGNAKLDTALKVFGSASLELDGTGDYVSVSDHADWNLAGGDFTVECRFRVRSNASGQQCFVSQYGVSGEISWFLQLQADNMNFTYSTDGTAITQMNRSFTPTLDTWYTVAVSRTTTTMYMFIDGVQQGATATVGTDVFNDSTQELWIGSVNVTPFNYVDGFIDEVRVTKGVGRYTAGYTPASAAFPEQAAGTPTATFGGTGANTILLGDSISAPNLTITESQISDLVHPAETNDLAAVTALGAVTGVTDVTFTGGVLINNGLKFGSVVAASVLDNSEHIALWGTQYGLNITASNLNFVADSVNTLSLTASQVTCKQSVDVTGNITLTGTVDGIDIAGMDADLTTAETTLADIPVGNLADGTDGELITWSAAGAPTTVAVGTSGHVLTSGGVGVAPTFQAAGGGSSAFSSGCFAITYGGQLNTYSNAPNSENWWAGNNRYRYIFDLSEATSIRLVMQVSVASASANTPIAKMQYHTSLPVTMATCSPLGASSTEVEVSLSSTGMVDSGWITITAGAQIDPVWLAFGADGGDGTADPAIADVLFMWK